MGGGGGAYATTILQATKIDLLSDMSAENYLTSKDSDVYMEISGVVIMFWCSHVTYDIIEEARSHSGVGGAYSL